MKKILSFLAIPVIAILCLFGAGKAQVAPASTKTVAFPAGVSIVNAGTITVTYWVCYELTADQIQTGEAVRLSDKPADETPQLVGTTFAPAAEFNISQIPTQACSKVRQAGKRELDITVKKIGGNLSTYVSFYTALPIATTTTVVDPNPFKSTDSVLVASLSQIPSNFLTRVKVGTGNFQVIPIFIPSGGKCARVQSPSMSKDEEATKTDISVSEVVQAAVYAPYSGTYTVKTYRFQTDLDGDTILGSYDQTNVSVTGPTCNSSNVKELYLPIIRGLMKK